MLGLKGKTALRKSMRISCRSVRGDERRGLDGFGSGSFSCAFWEIGWSLCKMRAATAWTGLTSTYSAIFAIDNELMR
jgi:hypothetical protein